jgi:hypothetical protein
VDKYHVALSFAGEDRAYVEAVAKLLVSHGVEVFYDKFEETNLWGKNLYTYLRDNYENKALFTVMFVSEHYKNKLWTNHERESAQARAFTESEEYILPAFFDESVEVPGLLKTTGNIKLNGKSPEEFSDLILDKLKKAGVKLSEDFDYSDEAKADVDFPMPSSSRITDILRALKSCNWYTQSPAIDSIFKLDLDRLSDDEIFVLGRNIYQCACGKERSALGILKDLRRELAKVPLKAALNLLNGMFFEVYFNCDGEFRGINRLKGDCLSYLLELQTAKKYSRSITFIRRALQPFKNLLPFLPNIEPETIKFELGVANSAPPLVKSLTLNGLNLLSNDDETEDEFNRVWKLSFVSFTIDELKERLVDAWSLPIEQVTINSTHKIKPESDYRLPKGISIRWPQ